TPTPDMAKARRRVKSPDPQWRFCFSTAVEFDPATDSVIVADSQRYRLKIYKKVRDDERRRRRTRKARTLGGGNAGHARRGASGDAVGDARPRRQTMGRRPAHRGSQNGDSSGRRAPSARG